MTRRRRWVGYRPPEPALRRWARDLRQDLGYALRQLRQAPGVSALIVLTLAIGIGANATMAGVIDRLLLRAPPYVETPDRLVRLFSRRSVDPRFGPYTSYPAFLDLQREVRAFDAVAAYTSIRLWAGTGIDAEELRATLVSSTYFSLLGASPTLGRAFTPADGFPTGQTPGGPALAVLSYGYWQRQFGGDPNVLGRALHLGRLTYTVVAVMPPGFRGVEAETPDIWLPLAVTADVDLRRYILEDRSLSWLQVVARLRPGATRAEAELQAVPVLRRDGPPSGRFALSQVLAASVIHGRGPDAPREVKVALWLGGVSALVLLIACANVANLLLGRAFVRRRETAVRLALGASRGRLARQLLSEAMVLAVLGAGGAILLAAVGGRVLQGLLAAGALGTGGFVDVRLFAFTTAITLGTGVLVSLAPLVQSTAPDLTVALRTGRATGGGRAGRVRATLLGLQAALCMLLLVVAGLFARSLGEVEGLDLGVDQEHTVVASINLNRLALPRPAIDGIYDDIVDRVRAIPGVVGVALAEANPYQGGHAVNMRTPEHGWDFYMHGMYYPPMLTFVDSNFFHVVGASLRGRDFSSVDVRGAPRVVIINEPAAQLLWPGEQAIGRCMLLDPGRGGLGPECFTVVGVTTGYWYHDILDRDRPMAYLPLHQFTVGLGRPGGMFVRTRGDAATILPAVRAAILGAWPDIPPVRVRRMRDLIDPAVRPWRTAATMFSLFGAVALVIAAVGLYAVVAFSAAQRSTEIAVRIALGAHARDVLAAVGGDGLRTVAIGLTVGAAAALGIRHWIGPLLFQTSPSDPGIIAGVAALLLGVAVLAILVPTVRALRRDPAAVLRVD
ncbi:MAG TPA: ABC transporter permease [Gemmatimonadaceae bacterium]|nr:ABC transporter permease [Gemmatimonadaceae bacterium]